MASSTPVGRVLLIDNELHPGTSAYCIGKVAQAMGLSIDDYSRSLDVINLHGHLRDWSAWASTSPGSRGRYAVIVLDA
jgi:hypothetical protein